MIKRIKNKLKKIENDEIYSPEQIEKMGIILDSNLNPSKFRVYTLIKKGALPAMNLGSGSNPKYFVKGRDLKQYVNKILQLS